jgi:hypothetical protein
VPSEEEEEDIMTVFTYNFPSNVMTVFMNVNLALQYDKES